MGVRSQAQNLVVESLTPLFCLMDLLYHFCLIFSIFPSSSSELNSKTNIIQKTSIPYGQKMTIDAKDNNHHYILFLARNTTGNGHGAFLLTGYGTGGAERYKIIQLDDGNAVEISVSGTAYIVSPKISGSTSVSIIYLMESKRPDVSVS